MFRSVSRTLNTSARLAFPVIELFHGLTRPDFWNLSLGFGAAYVFKAFLLLKGPSTVHISSLFFFPSLSESAGGMARQELTYKASCF